MRKGELLALRKSDVDLRASTTRVGRARASDTTKGNREDLLPVAVGLVPYLREAFAASPSDPLFPRAVCRRKGCGYTVRKSHEVPEPCPVCGMKPWPRALPRPLRFHDLRHTTATLLRKAGVPLATVQRILRHSDPAITYEVYVHLDVEDMRKGLNQFDFNPSHGAATESLKSSER